MIFETAISITTIANVAVGGAMFYDNTRWEA
jgi:hypothetical protein